MKTTNLTEGKVSRVFLGFFFPMLFANLLQQIYAFADTVIVGKGLGDNALAAVGNMSALFLLVIGFAQGVTNGFSVIVAQNFGSGNLSELRKSIAASMKLSFVLSTVLTVLSIGILKDVLLLMQTAEEILSDSLRYGYIILGGLTVTMAYNLCSGVLRALGDSRTPFFAIIISSVLNVLLDCLFIFVINIGVSGVAVATILSQAVSAMICILRLRRIGSIRVNRGDLKTDVALSFALLKNGILMACMNSVTAVGCMIVQSYVNALGVVYTSAYSACNKYINLFMLPAVTAGFSVSTFTSQNLGAKKWENIKAGVRIGLVIGTVSYLLLGSSMVLFPKSLAKIMLNGRNAVLVASEFMRICGSMLFLLNFLFVFRSAVQGMGKPLAPMCSGVLETTLRMLIIVLFLPRVGFSATAYAEVVAWTGALAVNLLAYIRVMKKERLKEGAY